MSTTSNKRLFEYIKGYPHDASGIEKGKAGSYLWYEENGVWYPDLSSGNVEREPVDIIAQEVDKGIDGIFQAVADHHELERGDISPTQFMWLDQMKYDLCTLLRAYVIGNTNVTNQIRKAKGLKPLPKQY